jgi:Sulfotransferase domain
MKRICLWSCPRNISTAMMYSFIQRPDTTAVDEPMYAHYLKTLNANHPGRDEVLHAQENDGEKVIAQIIMGNYTTPVVFFKQMTHHLLHVNTSFLQHTQNIIFIRNPAQIIASYAQVIPNVSLHDTGIEYQQNLFDHLTKNKWPCIILDSGELLKNPEAMLKKLCTRVGIEFFKDMLHWPAGPKKEDGIWAKYWYANVHKTTGFELQQTSKRPLPPHLEPLYHESKKYYDNLFQYSLKAD